MHSLRRTSLLLATALAGSPAPAAADAAAVFEAAAPSVFTVLAHQESGRTTGSAVVVAEERLATNHHVIRGAQVIELRQAGRSLRARVIAEAPQHDLALLEAPGLQAPIPPFGATSGLRIGQSVYAIGSPLGLEHSLSTGVIAAIRQLNLGRMLQITAPISPGSSGGGLFDGAGRLIGFTTLQASDGQNLNFAIPVEALARLGIVPAPVSAESVATVPPPQAAVSPPPATPAVTVEPAAPEPVAQARPRPSPARLLFWLLVPLALLAAARPATHALTEWLSSRGDGSPARAGAEERRLALARQLEPFRRQARAELQERRRDEPTWLEALQHARGDETAALPAYVELRARGLRRAELDRKWSEAVESSRIPPSPPGSGGSRRA